ncbi:hypothetical protein [Novosphingobium resinovorum]|nr:hypothetical protein [Novosphingobium resinovorum]
MQIAPDRFADDRDDRAIDEIDHENRAQQGQEPSVPGGKACNCHVYVLSQHGQGLVSRIEHIEQISSHLHNFFLNWKGAWANSKVKLLSGIPPMKSLLLALTALTLSAPAFAADAPVIDRNEAIFSAEGTKLGKIDRVLPGADGTASTVRVIYRGKFITIPVQTLSTGEKGLTTSLTNAELKKL